MSSLFCWSFQVRRWYDYGYYGTFLAVRYAKFPLLSEVLKNPQKDLTVWIFFSLVPIGFLLVSYWFLLFSLNFQCHFCFACFVWHRSPGLWALMVASRQVHQQSDQELSPAVGQKSVFFQEIGLWNNPPRYFDSIILYNHQPEFWTLLSFFQEIVE